MKKYSVFSFLLFLSISVSAQKIDRIIKVKKVSAIEKTLAADEMEGRGLFTPGIDKAADYIAKSFKKARLQPISASTGYFQEFSLISAIQTAARGNINGRSINDENIIAFTTQESLTVNEQAGFQVVRISAADKLLNTAYRYIMSGKSYIVCVDNTHSVAFQNLNRLKRERFRSDNSVIFILTDQSPVTFSFTITHRITEKNLKNVVGLLPGKSKKNEFVIFSGHYDHLGIGEPDAKGDSIFNGANDDASGTTAVMMLAKYFKKLNNNERTLVFAAFTAEETGGYGSQYFSKQFDADQVMAMFNIEMIGTESKWGRNSAYITGYEKTNMGEILKKNLEGTSFKFHPDPYPDQQLFYRSDNATLAMLGVPAHTISTSKMDNEPYYHTPGDEFSTLDLNNMTEIIKAIALSAASIVSGKDTPSRVDRASLR